MNHDQWIELADRLEACKSKAAGCSDAEEKQIRTEFQRISDEQDRALRTACAHPGSSLCRTMLDEANRGTATQLALAHPDRGALPEEYLAGSDFNTNVRLVQQRVDAYDIAAACNANPAQCDRQRRDGAMRLVVTGVTVTALAAASVELATVGAGVLAQGAGVYCATRMQQCMNLISGIAEMVSGATLGSMGGAYASRAPARSWAGKVPEGYKSIEIHGLPTLPPRTSAVVDTATGEIKLLTSNGNIVDIPPSPLPTWSSAASNAEVKIVWGKGVEAQGAPWETYLETQLPLDSKLPPGFKTFDFYVDGTQTAVSAKTLDTMSTSYLTNPGAVYSKLAGYVNEVAEFPGARLGSVEIDSANVSARELRLAVPASTTPSQWAQIERAIQYGQSQGVKLIVTGVQ